MPAIQLIVGLANPGKEYATTRHNAGAWLVEELAHTANLQLRHENKYHGMHAFTTLVSQPCHLLIPTTFMNHSGQAVRACATYHKIPTDEMIVAHDDIDLPVGTMRLKFDGGDGGHNGLKDIIRHLGTKQFYRLRIGIGRPTHSKDVVDYVLEPPSKAEQKTIMTAISCIHDILPLLLGGETQKAMQQLHTES